jgi:hypothetical protein
MARRFFYALLWWVAYSASELRASYQTADAPTSSAPQAATLAKESVARCVTVVTGNVITFKDLPKENIDSDAWVLVEPTTPPKFGIW